MNSVAFSPSGLKYAFTSHNGIIGTGIISKDGVIKEYQQKTWDKLPFNKIIFKDDDLLIAGGFDNFPVAFRINDKGIPE